MVLGTNIRYGLARPKVHLGSKTELVALLCKTEEEGLRGDPVWVRVALPQRVRGSAVGWGAVGKKSVRSSFGRDAILCEPWGGVGSPKLPSFTQPDAGFASCFLCQPTILNFKYEFIKKKMLSSFARKVKAFFGVCLIHQCFYEDKAFKLCHSFCSLMAKYSLQQQ